MCWSKLVDYSNGNRKVIMNKNKGFTLIELLVVIAIIAILAAILFPVFAKVREKARQATCQSNEKQIGLGILQYVQDYDEKFPGGAPGAVQSAEPGMGWAGAISPYIKSTGIFKCPDDTGSPVTTGGFTAYPISYAMNLYLGNEPQAVVQDPATIVLTSEVSGAVAYLSYSDEGLSEVTGGVTRVSPVTTGYPVNGCGANCGGTDSNPGYDLYGGVKSSGGVITATAASGESDATGGTFARHDPSSTAYAGLSEYLMTDGHVKAIHIQAVSSGEHAWAVANLPSNLVVTYDPYSYNL